MMYWNGEWNWGAWVGMTVMMVVFWGALAWGLVSLARGQRHPSDLTPQQILDARLARGEITIEEFKSLSAALRS